MDKEKNEQIVRTKKQSIEEEKAASSAAQKKQINKSKKNDNNQRIKQEQAMEIKTKTKNRFKQASATTASSKNKKKKRKKLSPEQIQQRKKQKRRKTRVEIIKFMAPVLVVALLVFFLILKTSPHMVDGESMSPTLANKDRVVVRRTKAVKRYEIITFKPPVDSKFQYVKRIIGMPGDLIWVEGNDLFINQQSADLPDVSERTSTTALPDGTIKMNVSDTCAQQLKSLDKIPEGYYFVLGDNRNNSSDSRAFGLVNEQAIEGVVSFRYLPLNHIGFIK